RPYDVHPSTCPFILASVRPSLVFVVLLRIVPPRTSLSRSRHSLCSLFFFAMLPSFILLTLYFPFGLGTRSPYINPPLFAEYRVPYFYPPPLYLV
ncbi:hypothetical protein EDB86DRAFT_2940632, partial [Lactarius hatsudake]